MSNQKNVKCDTCQKVFPERKTGPAEDMNCPYCFSMSLTFLEPEGDVKHFYTEADYQFAQSLTEDRKGEEIQFDTITEALHYPDNWIHDPELYEAVRYAIYRGHVEAIGVVMIEELVKATGIQMDVLTADLEDERSSGTCEWSDNICVIEGTYSFAFRGNQFSFSNSTNKDQWNDVSYIQGLVNSIRTAILSCDEAIEEIRLYDFIDRANLLAPKPVHIEERYSIFAYLWDDYQDPDFLKLTSSVEYSIYTLVDSEGTFLFEGLRYVNRLGYILAKNHIPLSDAITVASYRAELLNQLEDVRDEEGLQELGFECTESNADPKHIELWENDELRILVGVENDGTRLFIGVQD